jgi:hypothetical protein
MLKMVGRNVYTLLSGMCSAGMHANSPEGIFDAPFADWHTWKDLAARQLNGMLGGQPAEQTPVKILSWGLKYFHHHGK